MISSHRSRFGVRIARRLLWAPTLVFGTASAGQSFTLVATEGNTKDMSVNLGVDALRGDATFGGESIQPPISAGADRDTLISILNHDSGVLDIQHTFLVLANFSSRILLQFQTLEKELQARCWTPAEASSLRATLRLYIIPPYGPSKQNRLLGISPTVHLPPAVGLDPPPANVPIAVYRQAEQWIEGAGQNSFFTASIDPELLLDTRSVGVRAPGTVWEGVALPEASDVCLNREAGLEAVGSNGNRAPLCYDDDPDWTPWVEWDVSEAVRFWMNSGFDAATYHGFALYQWPGRDRLDQVRISPEVAMGARSRAVVSFASSSGAADCGGAGGKWGGRSEQDTVYGNTLCMTTAENDFEPNPIGAGALTVPRYLAPLVHPEWAPQLVIENVDGDSTCPASLTPPERAPDVARGEQTMVAARFVNRSESSSVSVIEAQVEPAESAFALLEDGCQGRELQPGEGCDVALTFGSDTVGVQGADLAVQYLLDENELLAVTALRGTVSEDGDGVPDATEDQAPSGGDGNGDSVADRRQSYVASFPGLTGEFVTLEATGAARIRSVAQVDLQPSAAIGAVQFASGFWGFELSGLPDGGQVDVRLLGIPADSAVYYVFGERAAAPEWHSFAFDGVSGARFLEDGVTVRWVDGEWGDADGMANGTIRVLPGGPGRVDSRSFRLTNARVGAVHPLASLLALLSLLGWVWRARTSRPA